jgi:hypothetical protein
VDENAGKTSLHEGGGAPGHNRMLQQSEPCFKTFARPAGKRKLPSGKRPVSCATPHGLALSRPSVLAKRTKTRRAIKGEQN